MHKKQRKSIQIIRNPQKSNSIKIDEHLLKSMNSCKKSVNIRENPQYSMKRHTNQYNQKKSMKLNENQYDKQVPICYHEVVSSSRFGGRRQRRQPVNKCIYIYTYIHLFFPLPSGGQKLSMNVQTRTGSERGRGGTQITKKCESPELLSKSISGPLKLQMAKSVPF